MARPTLLLVLLAGLTLVTACGGNGDTTEDAGDAAGASSVAATDDAAPARPTPAAAADPVEAPPGPAGAPSAEPLPTAADSAAALAEDVSPEWKMRTRQMQPFADCMKQTRDAPDAVRPALVEACHRLPDAPRRP